MKIVEFLVLSFCHLTLIFWIIKRQGVASVEGYCVGWLGIAALTDNLMLVFDYFVQPGTLPLGAEEFSFRVYPTIVHIIALIVLMAGLFLGNPKPEPISREFSAKELDFVAYTGVALVVVGLILSGFAIYLTGAYSASNYFETLDNFRSMRIPTKWGGFWLKGADIAIFGLALTLPRLAKRWAGLLVILLAMMLVSFFLKSGKGGFESALFLAALVLYTYNPRRLWFMVRPGVALAGLGILLLGIGVKVELKNSEKGTEPWTWNTLADSIAGPIGARWGDQGLYRGYCQFINLLPRYHYLFEGYAEGMDTVAGWVPRGLNPKKRSPHGGVGFMIYADFHAYAGDTPAVGLVGSVYADDGFYTLTAYLLIAGFLLGVLRRYAAGRRSPLQWQIAYLMFALFKGLSDEAGIAPIIYTFILTFAVASLAHLFVVGLFQRKVQAGAIPARPVARRSFSAV